MQTVPMWRVVEQLVFGIVTTDVRAMFASPALGVSDRAGAPGGRAAWSSPCSFRLSFGAKSRSAQFATWKWRRARRSPPSVADDGGVDRERIAVGRVEREARPVEVDLDERTAAGSRRGSAAAGRRPRVIWAVTGSTWIADPDDDVAEVVGPETAGTTTARLAARPCTGRRGRPSRRV